MKNDTLIVSYAIIGILILLIGNLFTLTDTWWSILYILFALLSSSAIWIARKKTLSIFFFFILSYDLFIGGRFFAHALNPSLDVFSSTVWYEYELKDADKIFLMNYILGFLFFCVLGFLIYNRKERKVRFEPRLSVITKEKINSLLNIFFYILVPYILVTSVQGLLLVMSRGYGTNLLFETDYEVNFVQKFANLLLIAFTGMAMAWGDKKLIKRYFILYIIKGIFNILCGSRGMLGAVIFMSLWAYSFYRPINFKKLFLYSGVAVVAMLLLFSVSVRGRAEELESLSLWESFTAFIYTNGISLMVFDASTKVTGYPALPYFQTLIVGANFIYTLFTGVHLDAQDVTFQGYLCNELNSGLFNQGLGLGWTTNGDLYLFSGRIFVVYCILSMLLGCIFCIIDQWSRKSKFFLYFAASMAPALFLMARGSLSALFPQIFYSYLFFFLVKWLARTLYPHRKMNTHEIIN